MSIGFLTGVAPDKPPAPDNIVLVRLFPVPAYPVPVDAPTADFGLTEAVSVTSVGSTFGVGFTTGSGAGVGSGCGGAFGDGFPIRSSSYLL